MQKEQQEQRQSENISQEQILFSKDGPYAEFSNFYPSEFSDKEKAYKTNEHYFQSQKYVTTDEEYAQKIRNAQTPQQAMQFGRSREHPLRADWEEVKQETMLQGLRMKFAQSKDLTEKLIQTGNRKIVEYHKTDKYWGNGGDGSGKNVLGTLIMQVRGELKNLSTEHKD